MRHEDSKICRARLLRKAFQCHMDWKQPLQQGKSWSPHLASCKAFGAAQRAGWWSLWLKNCHHPAFQSIFPKCLDFYQTLPSPQRIHLESKTSVLGWEFPASGTLGGSNTIPFDPSYTSQIPTISQQVKRKKDTWHDFLSIASPLTLGLFLLELPGKNKITVPRYNHLCSDQLGCWPIGNHRSGDDDIHIRNHSCISG